MHAMAVRVAREYLSETGYEIGAGGVPFADVLAKDPSNGADVLVNVRCGVGDATGTDLENARRSVQRRAGDSSIRADLILVECDEAGATVRHIRNLLG